MRQSRKTPAQTRQAMVLWLASQGRAMSPRPLSDVIKGLRAARTSANTFYSYEEYGAREAVADELEQWAKTWDVELQKQIASGEQLDGLRRAILGQE